MQNIAILYGGKSVEHDISVLTALQVMQNLDKKKYNIIPIYQTHNCEFIIPDDYTNPKTYIGEVEKFKKVTFAYGKGEVIVKNLFKKRMKIDCAINCCHGNSGEDGTLNAVMNLAHIPITSSSILGSSTCMDKVIMKDIFKANNINCVDYRLITADDDKESKLEEIVNALGFPLIVKPSNLGSSIGINKSTDLKSLSQAIEIAFYYDSRVIVEKCLEDFKEINISCLGDTRPEFSRLEQPLSWQNFLDFDKKYTDSHAKKILDPNLGKGVIDEIKNISQKVWKIFDLSGVVRIDYMVKDDEVYINEINTIPGSLAFYLWKNKYDFFELLDKLIQIAISRFNRQNKHKYTFTSSVLADYKPNSMNKYAKR